MYLQAQPLALLPSICKYKHFEIERCLFWQKILSVTIKRSKAILRYLCILTIITIFTIITITFTIIYNLVIELSLHLRTGCTSKNYVKYFYLKTLVEICHHAPTSRMVLMHWNCAADDSSNAGRDLHSWEG